MSGKIDKLVEAGNALIDALKGETDYDSEDASWKLEKDDIKYINEKNLINLTQLSHNFSQRCLDLEGETWDKTWNNKN